MDQNKATTIALVNAPQNNKELQKFLREVNYLRIFISNLASKTKELSNLGKLKDMGGTTSSFSQDQRVPL